MPKLPTWDDVKRVADEVEKKVQNAGATAREKWNHQVRPKLTEIQKKIEATGQRASESIQDQVIALNDALGKFQHELAEDLKIGRKPPAEPKKDD